MKAPVIIINGQEVDALDAIERLRAFGAIIEAANADEGQGLIEQSYRLRTAISQHLESDGRDWPDEPLLARRARQSVHFTKFAFFAGACIDVDRGILQLAKKIVDGHMKAVTVDQ